MIKMREDDLSGEQTRALLALHLAGMHANSPPESVFALDLSGLQAPGITVWSAWDGGRIAGVGALKRQEGKPAEIKSMRTHPDHLRKGVARMMLAHIVDEARREGIDRLHLETGRGPAFEPALALYRAHGFVNGPAFGDYAPNPFSQFLYLTL
jgi:putative acetyltransferase